jgi:hypothetical protein
MTDGTKKKRSILTRRQQQIQFALKDVDSVALDYREEPDADGPGFDRIWQGKLRIRNPRRAILLIESRQGNEVLARSLAEEVCRTAGFDLMDESVKPVRRTPARDLLAS